MRPILQERIRVEERRAAIGRPSPWLRLAVLLVALFLMLPSVIVVMMSFSSGKLLTFPPPGYGLDWYAHFFDSRQWTDSTLISLQIALLATAAATVLGTLAAIALVRGRPRGAGLMRAILLSPMIVPLIVTGLGMYIAVRQAGLASYPALVAAHTVLGVPYVLLAVSASLYGLPREYDHAAHSLGASRGYTLWHVTLPLIRPGVAVGALFAFVTSWDELVVALFLSEPTTRTLPVTMWEQARYTTDPTIAAASSMLTMVTFLVLLAALLLRGLRRAQPA